MKIPLPLVVMLMAVDAARTSAIPVNGVLPRSARRDLNAHVEMVERTHVQGCNADNVLRKLRNPTRSVLASAFCSVYLQRTVTKSSTHYISRTRTVTKSTTITKTTTTTITTTSTSTSTNSGLCPSGTAVICNLQAYGFQPNLISQTFDVDPFTCHQSCLSDPLCLSFQISDDGRQVCNLYNVPTLGNSSPFPDVYVFFDRDCPQYLPAQCTPERLMKRTAPIPEYLATVPPTRISSACSCFITSPSAPTTTHVIVSSTRSVTRTATKTKTIEAIKTSVVTIVTTI